jgi:hypothetical protein
MKPPKKMLPTESFKQMNAPIKFSRNLLEKNCHMPGHSAVSETDLHQRERPGTFPFNMEGKVLTLRFKTFFSSFIVPQAFVEDKFKFQIVHFHLLDPKIEPKEAKTSCRFARAGRPAFRFVDAYLDL